jgi:hypothetical protein
MGSLLKSARKKSVPISCWALEDMRCVVQDISRVNIV